MGRSDGAAVQGSCLSADGCLGLRAVANPDLGCAYTDRTPVVTGPPEASCPPSADAAPFCAGACGDVACPATSADRLFATFGGCIGLSDTRGFGVCTYASRMFLRGGTYTGYATSCEEFYGAPCGIMILHPQPASVGDEEWGWFVLQEACLRYREAYPEGVECFDYEWARL